MNRFLQWIGVIMILAAAGVAGVSAGEITGNVSESSSGQPISGLDMNIYDEDWNFVDINAQTAGGEYHFYDVPAGTYYVRANPQDPFHYQHQYWENSPDRANATAIVVPATGVVENIDFSLDPGWYIEGKVSDVDGGVLGGIDINVYTLDWEKADVDAETDEYGRYEIGGLPEGQYYVMANPEYMQPYVDQYYDHSAGPNNAVPVSLVAPNDLVGISFTLLDGSYIRGRVTDKDTGQPLAGYWVKGYNSRGNKMRLEDQTDSQGYYTLGAYAVGEYYVKVDPSYPDGYMDTFYPQAFNFDDAELVSITAPKPTYNIDISVPAGSYIRGKIQSESQQNLEDIKVKFYDRDWHWMEFATTISKDNGQYISGALKPGKYYVKAVPIYPQPWIDEYYPDSIEKSDAEEISVALAGETTSIDFALQPGGYLSGTILHADNQMPLDDIDLDVYDGQWNWVDYSDQTNSHGYFLIGALPFGEYILRADPNLSQGFIPQYYNLAFMPEDAHVISLTAAQNQDSLDFALSDGGFVSGTIRNAETTALLSGIEIKLVNGSDKELPLHTVRSDDDGQYTVHGIPSGTYYVLAADADDDGFDTQYYSGASSLSTAQTVTVSTGSTTSGIDFDLTPTIAPTATPAVSLGVELELSSSMFESGDIFYLNARVSNPGQPMEEIPLFVILDAFGAMYCWPSWRSMDSGADFQTLRLETGVQVIPIFPAFEWPKVDGSANGIMFYGGMTRADFSRLLGDMDAVAFGYE